MRSPVDIRAGQALRPVVTGKDQNGQPYGNFSIQLPLISPDPTIVAYDGFGGVPKIIGQQSGIGKSASIDVVLIDNTDPTKTVTKTQVFNVVAQELFLADADIDWVAA